MVDRIKNETNIKKSVIKKLSKTNIGYYWVHLMI